MAVKNHEMDGLIKKAAMDEFLEYGYSVASLRRIASKAGTTTGSLYMRYKNKNAIFKDLTRAVTDEAEKAFRSIKPVYDSVHSLSDMLKAVELETSTTLSILFDHYDESVLLFCKSHGSDEENFFNELTERKIKSSDEFFHNFPDSPDLKNAFEILLSMQYDICRLILNKGLNRKEAESCMNTIMKFMKSGWAGIMDEFMPKAVVP